MELPASTPLTKCMLIVLQLEVQAIRYDKINKNIIISDNIVVICNIMGSLFN